MPNVKISAATDAGTLLSSDMLPLARSGDTNAYHATMAEIATYTGASVSSGAYGNVGRNLIHNPMFRNWQRGISGFATSGYTADRWQLGFNLDTSVLVNQVAVTDAERASIGDEAAEWALQTNVVGNAGAASYTFVCQPNEDVRRLGGKTVTVSFWAWAASGTPGLGVSIDQRFGTGGSPSAAVLGSGQSVTLGVTPARYSLTFAVASTSGKTLGTNNDDCTALNFWFSSGTTTAVRAGSIGVQTTNVAIWGVQLEIGGVATPLAKRDIADELLLCMRFYQGILNLLGAGYATAGIPVQISSFLPVPMRAAPAVTLISNANANVSGLGVAADTVTAWTTGASVTATGAWSIQQNIGLSADL